MGLMKPINDRSLKDQETFRHIRENQLDIDKQINDLNKTVFHDGKGLNIFDQLDQKMTQLNQDRKDLEEMMDARLKGMENKVQDSLSK